MEFFFVWRHESGFNDFRLSLNDLRYLVCKCQLSYSYFL